MVIPRCDLLGRPVDAVERDEAVDARVALGEHLGDRGRQSGLAVVDVTHRPDVEVRLGPHELALGHEDFPLLSEDSMRARTLRAAFRSAVTARRGPVSEPPSSAGPAQQEEGRIRAPVKVAESTDAHVGAPVRPVPDRSDSKTTRDMRITVGRNAAKGNRNSRAARWRREARSVEGEEPAAVGEDGAGAGDGDGRLVAGDLFGQGDRLRGGAGEDRAGLDAGGADHHR